MTDTIIEFSSAHNNTLPEPLMPEDANVRGMPWVGVHLLDLIRSNIWSEAYGDPWLGIALFSLLTASLDELPAGSLPDNDAALARWALIPREEWARIKSRVMAEFTLCRDSRWYHRKFCEGVLHSWEWRKLNSERTKKATEAAAEKRKLERERKSSVTESVTSSVTSSVHYSDSDSDYTGTGKKDSGRVSYIGVGGKRTGPRRMRCLSDSTRLWPRGRRHQPGRQRSNQMERSGMRWWATGNPHERSTTQWERLSRSA